MDAGNDNKTQGKCAGQGGHVWTITFGKKDEQIFLGKEISKSRDYSEEKSTIIDKEITNLVKNSEFNASNILKKVGGISFVYFDETDVVRHKLVKNIIKAYAKHDTKKKKEKKD